MPAFLTFRCPLALRLLVLVALSIPASDLPAPCQAPFNAASRLLARMWQDRISAKDAESRKRVGAEIAQTLPHVRALIEKGIGKELGQRRHPSGPRLQDELRRALAATGQPESISAAVLVAGSAESPYYVVAYAIPWCAVCSRSAIEAYGRSSNQYKLLAESRDPLPNATVGLSPLPSVARGKVEFVAYGTNLGDPHNRLTVVVYEFDGRELSTVWQRVGLAQGQLGVHRGRIELDFLTAARGPGGPAVPERLETYRMTPSGIVLESSREKR